MKITPLDASVPQGAQNLIDKVAASLPHVKITELILEVDRWTGFTRHLTYLKSGDVAKDRIPVLTTILADAINLGLSKMAESCPGSSYAELSWLRAWHIRDDTYSAALAELANAQFQQSFAENWGDGTTSSSDGQRFKAGGKAESTLLEELRTRCIVFPPIAAIERLAGSVRARAQRQLWRRLADGLTDQQCQSLDQLLEVRAAGGQSTLGSE